MSRPKPKRVQSMKNQAFKRDCKRFFFFFSFDKVNNILISPQYKPELYNIITTIQLQIMCFQNTLFY